MVEQLSNIKWDSNYWLKDSEENKSWKVYLKTEFRNILVAMFDDSYPTISYMIKNEKKIFNKYNKAGRLYAKDPNGNYYYEYLGPSLSLLSEIPTKAKQSGETLYTIYCPQTTVTFLVNKIGRVIDSYQGRNPNVV